MGVWGTGLYAGDFALDLRAMIAALCRLPLDGDRILEILREQEPAAENARDEDHTTFWLVVADQFDKRGIECAQAAQTALGIIRDGADSALLERRLLAPSAKKERQTLAKPQPFIMDVGDVFVYPTSQYRPLNPYLKSRDHNLRPPYNWKHDGWSAMVILNRGRAFDYLAWYALLVLDDTYNEKPALEQLMAHTGWTVTTPGTCSRLHFRRMELEQLGHVGIEPRASARFHPSQRACVSAAASDISIVNRMRARPVMTSKGPWPTVQRLADVLISHQ